MLTACGAASEPTRRVFTITWRSRPTLSPRRVEAVAAVPTPSTRLREPTPSRRLVDGRKTQARFSLVVLTFMWLAIGSKEIPNIATNWFVCAVVLGLTQYPVMRAHWKESYARVYDMMGIDPDTGETVSEKKAKKKR